MRPLASSHETLEDHIKLCLSYLNTYFLETGYARNVARIIGTSEEEAKRALKATVLFHDFGKAADEYQKKSADKISFPKHEYFSAASALRTFAETGWKTSAVAAILLHHMAMRGPNLLANFNTWKKYNAPERATFPDEFIQSFVAIADEHGIGNIMNVEIPRTLTLKDVETTVKTIHDKLVKPSEWRANYILTLRLLRPLLIVDNLAAAMLREGLPKVYVKDLPKPETLKTNAELLKRLTDFF
ncbi:MAG: CRISPR-associated endonuclease Cas3'' [Candidatus Caldarchaeum sp.]|nr:CRISPR-associated endonuclease Cas3'' [Candidatus Caldarchaeum sp.]